MYGGLFNVISENWQLHESVFDLFNNQISKYVKTNSNATVPFSFDNCVEKNSVNNNNSNNNFGIVEPLDQLFYFMQASLVVYENHKENKDPVRAREKER